MLETAKDVATVGLAEQPDAVTIAVFTDGKENVSETPLDAVRGRVECRQEPDDWEFMFIGANQDAERRGIERDGSLTMVHDGEGIRLL